MKYRDLRDFIAQLENIGELKRVAAEVALTTLVEIANSLAPAGK